MKIKYRNPPINELIIGVYFDQPILPLRSEHIGLFWSEVRGEFSKIQQQPELAFPIVGPPAFQIGFTDEPYPMPRFWLISKNDAILLQIQKNAFLLNWRKRDSDYPHFENVKSSFDKYFLTGSPRSTMFGVKRHGLMLPLRASKKEANCWRWTRPKPMWTLCAT
jgi:uncharacterized protein (TIGR04255 family)